MPQVLKLHADRLFSSDAEIRAIARRLYAEVAALPIISPHGHTDPEWWATDAPGCWCLAQQDRFVRDSRRVVFRYAIF